MQTVTDLIIELQQIQKYREPGAVLKCVYKQLKKLRVMLAYANLAY